MERLRRLLSSLLGVPWRLRGHRMRIEHLFTQQERPLSFLAHVGIAVRCVERAYQHIGILHRDVSAGDVMLLHLAWHHDLRNHRPGNDYLWIDIPLSHFHLRQIAAICRLIGEGNPDGLPYAFSPPNGCFDATTGRFLIGPTRYGLTCASFVLAVFETAGLPLVRYETWPNQRPDDRNWQEFVLSRLRDSNPRASDAHIAALQEEIGAVRYRPEEVASAATLTDIPASFQIVQPLSMQLLDKLRRVTDHPRN
jgi:hypothetical protein